MLDKLFEFFRSDERSEQAVGQRIDIPAGADPLPHLEKLRLLDTKFEIFGARKHRYLSTPINEAELVAFESRLGVRFPREYRKHLTEVGYGAGPYYALETPESRISELCWDIEWLEREEGGSVRPSDDFFLTSSEILKAEKFLDPEKRVPMVAGTWPSNGCLQIADQGCQGSSVLILAGEFRGCVFEMEYDGDDRAFWFPARRPPGRVVYGEGHMRVELEQLRQPPTFNEWYIGWLERGLSDLSAFQ